MTNLPDIGVALKFPYTMVLANREALLSQPKSNKGQPQRYLVVGLHVLEFLKVRLAKIASLRGYHARSIDPCLLI
jgi:hypothetical protein